MNASPFVPAAEKFRVRIGAIDFLSMDVVRVLLQSETGRGTFYEGQYLSLTLPDGDARCYSYAARCNGDGQIELHVRLHPDGKFSNLLRTTLRAGDVLEATGPFGACTWQRETDARGPVLMLATGTGLAPLKAMIESVMHETQQPVWLYWGGYTVSDLYMDAHFRALDARTPDFYYRPVLSRPQEGWTGDTGFVQNVAAAGHPVSRVSRVYACGSPAMVESARALFVDRLGLKESLFLSDAFEPGAPQAESGGESGLGGQSLVTLSIRTAAGEQSVLDVPSGANLKSVLQDAGLVRAVCGGRQSCGTCRVQLSRTQFPLLAAPRKAERRLLQALPEAGPFDRLSCQLFVDSSWDQMSFEIPPHAW